MHSRWFCSSDFQYKSCSCELIVCTSWILSFFLACYDQYRAVFNHSKLSYHSAPHTTMCGHTHTNARARAHTHTHTNTHKLQNRGQAVLVDRFIPLWEHYFCLFLCLFARVRPLDERSHRKFGDLAVVADTHEQTAYFKLRRGSWRFGGKKKNEFKGQYPL